MADQAAGDIKEVKEWKTGPEVDGLNDMVKGINACIQWINEQKQKGNVIKFVARDDANERWIRFEAKGTEIDEVTEDICETTCNSVCDDKCNDGSDPGSDVGSA